MALESALYINQLDPANPPGTDQLSQADDHLRLIKGALKATFPNITGPVTLSQSDLNTSNKVPVGVISLWYGSAASIPLAYALCNGQTIALSDGSGTIVCPDLRNLVVMGAGTLAAQGTAYGLSTSTANTTSGGGHTPVVTVPDHSHTITVAGHVLTVSEMPVHSHDSGIAPDNSGNRYPYSTSATSNLGADVQKAAPSANPMALTGPSGGGQAHSHTGTGNSQTLAATATAVPDHIHVVQVSTMQPALALHYIMKI